MHRVRSALFVCFLGACTTSSRVEVQPIVRVLPGAAVLTCSGSPIDGVSYTAEALLLDAEIADQLAVFPLEFNDGFAQATFADLKDGNYRFRVRGIRTNEAGLAETLLEGSTIASVPARALRYVDIDRDLRGAPKIGLRSWLVVIPHGLDDPRASEFRRLCRDVVELRVGPTVLFDSPESLEEHLRQRREGLASPGATLSLSDDLLATSLIVLRREAELDSIPARIELELFDVHASTAGERPAPWNRLPLVHQSSEDLPSACSSPETFLPTHLAILRATFEELADSERFVMYRQELPMIDGALRSELAKPAVTARVMAALGLSFAPGATDETVERMLFGEW